jgi:DNA-directed RNA polymerase subunit beta'
LICPPVHWKKILYFASYVVLDPGQHHCLKKQILSEKEFRDSLEKYEVILKPVRVPKL